MQCFFGFTAHTFGISRIDKVIQFFSTIENLQLFFGGFLVFVADCFDDIENFMKYFNNFRVKVCSCVFF